MSDGMVEVGVGDGGVADGRKIADSEIWMRMMM